MYTKKKKQLMLKNTLASKVPPKKQKKIEKPPEPVVSKNSKKISKPQAQTKSKNRQFFPSCSISNPFIFRRIKTQIRHRAIAKLREHQKDIQQRIATLKQ